MINRLCDFTLPSLVLSHCGSGDIAYLICQVTLQDHVIKGSPDFTEGSSSLNIAIGIVVMEILF